MSAAETPTIPVPATVKEATALLTRYSKLAAGLATVEGKRKADLAVVNAAADRVANPIVARMAPIAAALEAWWPTASAELTGGKRKSIELGGCMIGSRTIKAKLAHDDDEAALAVLREARWAKPYVRVTYAIDRGATLKALAGAHGDKLREIGFRSVEAEQFVLDPVDQGGTVASTASK